MIFVVKRHVMLTDCRLLRFGPHRIATSLMKRQPRALRKLTSMVRDCVRMLVLETLSRCVYGMELM